MSQAEEVDIIDRKIMMEAEGEVEDWSFQSYFSYKARAERTGNSMTGKWLIG